MLENCTKRVLISLSTSGPKSNNLSSSKARNEINYGAHLEAVIALVVKKTPLEIVFMVGK